MLSVSNSIMRVNWLSKMLRSKKKSMTQKKLDLRVLSSRQKNNLMVMRKKRRGLCHLGHLRVKLNLKNLSKVIQDNHQLQQLDLKLNHPSLKLLSEGS